MFSRQPSPMSDYSFWVRSMKIGLFIALIGGPAAIVHAQRIAPETAKLVQNDPIPYEPDYSEWSDCGLRKEDVDVFVSHRSARSKSEKKRATINVTYSSDFPEEAIEAYERAVSIWERHIESNVEIRIDAGRISNPEPGVLGGTIPANFWVIGTEAGDRFIAGDALADAIVGSDIGEENLPEDNPQEEVNPPDMITDFNFDRDDWHFGDGDAPSGDLDFTTVALHEIAHGLHYLSLCRFDQGTGQCKFELSDGSREAGVYTDFLFEQSVDGDLTALTDEQAFPPNSTALGDALTGGQLVFSGSIANEAAQDAGPVPPKIYAPSSYEPGSSISHLDERTYTPGGPNALMTPTINAAETNRLPGPIVCGQLLDMGWTAGSGCAFDEISIGSVTANAQTSQSNQGSVSLNWTLSGAAGVDRFVVERIYFGQKEGEKTVAADQGPGEYSTSFSELDVGEHTFRVNYVTTDGNRVQAGDTPSIKIEAQTPDVSVYPNPFAERVNVSFTVPETQDVMVEVFDVLGRRVASLRRAEVDADDPRPVQFGGSELGSRGSGVYFIRVEGETFEQTVQAVRVR